MDTNILKCQAFVRTAECGSFTKAAELLQYSQSGVSRMIRDLEKDWGVTLLERSRAGVQLTSDGMKLLPYVRSLCSEYEKLGMQVDAQTGLQSGLIRIGTFSSVATHWLPNIIREFQKDCPGIEYELLLGTHAEIREWIADGRADCGFLRLPAPDGLEASFLEKDPLMAVLPEDHPLAGEERFPASALQDEPFLLLEKDGPSEVTEFLSANALRPNVRFTTWDDYAIMAMVESGLGISVLPKLILRRAPYHLAIRELDIPASRDIGFAVREAKAASVAVKRFSRYLPCRHGAKPESDPGDDGA